MERLKKAETDLLIKEQSGSWTNPDPTNTTDSAFRNEHLKIAERINELVTDGLVIIENDHVKVTEKGGAFVRNCCMAFDQHLQEVNSTEKMFSRTI